MTYNENWYHDTQIMALQLIVQRVEDIDGAVVEIGCWEGKSTVAIANATSSIVICVDNWTGSADENPDHETVRIMQTRDVRAVFEQNMHQQTHGNYVIFVQDWHDFATHFVDPIRLLHIDASHDYESVRDTIKAFKDSIVQSGIICGDDFLTASAERNDLQGGVERAVRETLPEFQTIGNFWFWIKE